MADTPDVPQSTPAPAPAAAPTSAPDLGALNQPGPSAAPDAASIQSQMAPFQAKEQAATQKAADLANQGNAPAAPVPHQRLLSMVQGLADGLSSFGTAIATHGREGGAAEVQQLEAGRAQQEQQKQAATTAQRNAQIQQQLMVADTNHKLAQNVFLMGTLPMDIAKSHVELESAQTGLAAQKFDLFANTGLSPQQIDKVTSGGTTDTKTSGILQNNAQQQYRLAAQLLPADNPALVTLKTALDDPKTATGDLVIAAKKLQNELAGQEKITAAKSAKNLAESNSPVAKLSTPEALSQPGAQAAIQAKIDDPTTDPADVSRLRELLPKAAVAQLNAENIKQREFRNQQAIQQGDPDAVGKMLADRTMTLEEAKARSATPDFIQKASASAVKYDPTFKAPEAAAQARVAAQPANAQFFGNTDSLLVNGGTLDQLAQAYSKLGNTSLPFANKLDNWVKAAGGSGPLAAMATAALSVADDYSKVISGGTGSDSSRQQALDIIGRDMSPDGMAASIAQMRSGVTSQRNGRISTNPYMKDMYPDPSTRQETPGKAGTQPAAPANASSEVWQNGKLIGHVVPDAKGVKVFKALGQQ